MEQREAENAARLTALREAARVGFDAFEQGKFKEFCNVDDLRSYLTDLSEKIIAGAAK